MCEISTGIKLCTCEFGNKFPDNYWMLYDGSAVRISTMLGETKVPYFKTDLKVETFYTQENLVKLLNQENVFDKKMQLNNGAKLELVFNLHRPYFKKAFSFYYENNEWIHNAFVLGKYGKPLARGTVVKLDFT